MNLELTQWEADALLAMRKHYQGSDQYDFPGLGGSVRIPLYSDDKHEEFSLDVTRGKITLSKNTYQHRTRRVIILVRLDIGGPPHRNPDGVEVSGNHFHVYKEGYADKYAVELPDIFNGLTDPLLILDKFMDYCNIETKPLIQRELFS